MILKNQKVNTRKPHFCYGCNVSYPSKTIMRVYEEVQEGKVLTTYFCSKCDEITKDWTIDDWESVTYAGEILENNIYENKA